MAIKRLFLDQKFILFAFSSASDDVTVIAASGGGGVGVGRFIRPHSISATAIVVAVCN